MSHSGASRGYRLLGDEQLADGLRRVARGRIDHALDELTCASDSSREEAVHEARKDLKKLRAVVRLVRGELGSDVYLAENAAFRDAARSLASTRDATVMVETLTELYERDPQSVAPPAFHGLRRVLEARRGELSRDGHGAAHEQATRALRAARRRVGRWPLEREGFGALEPGLVRTYRRGRQRMRAAEREPSAANLHEWRKRVKDHWYHLTLLRRAWPDLMEPAADAAHDLSEHLGDDHDLAMLLAVAREHSAALGSTARLDAFERGLERRRAELQAAAFVLGRRVYAERPGAFARRLRRWWSAPAGRSARVG